MLSGESDRKKSLRRSTPACMPCRLVAAKVDITNGKLSFRRRSLSHRAWQLTRPVKGASLIGNGPDVLTRITMVGNDLALDTGVGTCGKNGQSVPVGVGLPTIRINDLTVGGTRS